MSLLTAAALTCPAGCSGGAAPPATGATASPARQQTPEQRLTGLMVTAAGLGPGQCARTMKPREQPCEPHGPHSVTEAQDAKPR
ncbi:hypothetical protein [Streptomyces massasporeus]|uniref:hypothetical protein n=1 Tax=Streptomyces massasporeus TaxID=67324 RepID=UPI0033FCFDEF